MGLFEVIVIGTGIAAAVAVVAAVVGVFGYFYATSGPKPDPDGSEDS